MYILRTSIKKVNDWESVTFEHFQTWADLETEISRTGDLYPAENVEFEIQRGGSGAWLAYVDAVRALREEARYQESVDNGAPEDEDYIGSSMNGDPVIVTRRPEFWEVQAEEGYRFNVYVLQNDGGYLLLTSYWHSAPAVKCYDVLMSAAEILPEMR